MMYCPMCSTKAPDNQRYCKACGLHLEPHARTLTNQLAASEWDPSQLENINRARRLRYLGYSLLLGCLAALWGFLIIEKGAEAIWGALFFAVLVIAIFLIGAAQEQNKIRGANRSSRLAMAPPDPTTAQLPDADRSIPIPSVTEHTTDRLDLNKLADSERSARSGKR